MIGTSKEEVRSETGGHYRSAAKCLAEGLTAPTWSYSRVTGNKKQRGQPAGKKAAHTVLELIEQLAKPGSQ